MMPLILIKELSPTSNLKITEFMNSTLKKDAVKNKDKIIKKSEFKNPTFKSIIIAITMVIISILFFLTTINIILPYPYGFS